MAKKKQTKKHNFKYAAPATGVTTAVPTPVGTIAGEAVIAPKRAPGVVAGRNFAYVGHDLRRVGLLGGGLVAVELILWWAFGHTGLGNAVYNLVHV